MIVTFWIAVAAVVLWFVSSCTAVLFMDIWEGAEWAFLAGKLCGFVAIGAAVVFVAWFGLHAVGVTINVHHGGS